MYELTEYAKSNPAYIRWKDSKGNYRGWIGIGVDDPKKNKEAYAYAYRIGLTDWVAKADKKE